MKDILEFDAGDHEQSIKNSFEWLCKNGCRDVALSLLDELALCYRLLEHLQGKKSSYQARKDGDWERLTEGLMACGCPDSVFAWKVREKSLILTLPWTWRECLDEEIERRLINLKGLDP